MTKLAAVALLLGTAGTLTAQDTPPAFEVASVKINKSGGANRFIQPQPGGRLNVTNMPLRNLIAFAYQVRIFQVDGGPNWIDSVGFDIVAKAPGEVSSVSPGQPSEYQMMLRRLLADRFKLVVRDETREVPIYTLTLARSDGRLGPRITPSTTDCQALMKAASGRGGGPGPVIDQAKVTCGARIGVGRMEIGGFPIRELATSLTMLLQRPVVDRTGLNGNFDASMTFTPEPLPGVPALPTGPQATPVDPDAPSIFTALQEQLGLKLESTRGLQPLLVIDRAEMPAED